MPHLINLVQPKYTDQRLLQTPTTIGCSRKYFFKFFFTTKKTCNLLFTWNQSFKTQYIFWLKDPYVNILSNLRYPMMENRNSLNNPLNSPLILEKHDRRAIPINNKQDENIKTHYKRDTFIMWFNQDGIRTHKNLYSFIIIHSNKMKGSSLQQPRCSSSSLSHNLSHRIT